MPNTDLPAFPGGGRYRRLRPSLKERFGAPVHKVTLRAGFSCPNRDGRIGKGGCTFCAEDALVPVGRAATGPIEQQLAFGLKHNRYRQKTELAIAYFQEGCATDAPAERLREIYRPALEHPAVVAIAVGTRPDVLDDDVLDLLGEMARRKPVWLELGLQCADDAMLRRINRNHDVDDFIQAVRRSQARGLEVLAHVILDLPNESAALREQTASVLGELGVVGVKIHNLHVLKGTPLERAWRAGAIQLRDLESYSQILVDFLERLPEEMVIHRLTGDGSANLMLAPAWALEKARALQHICRVLEERNTWQGKKTAFR